MERRAITVQGVVQGVGFRPFVYGLASRLQLGGFVKNRTGGILIEVEGDTRSLDHFLAELSHKPPPLAQIEHLSWERQPPQGEQQFNIQTSQADPAGPIFVGPDVATCDDCLAELFDPGDRRYRYPFLNCTNCGPRLTIIRSVPYDRGRTTMAAFALCRACREEYEDPANRRFHAQPTCCPACGPSLRIRDGQGQPIATADPLAEFVKALRAGRIGALKGLGGYHLACDARHAEVVAELRRRKHRDEKPFAVMVRDVAAAEAHCEVGPAERGLLMSARRPVVLLRKRPTSRVAEGVAAGNPCLGVMLPYTPLHHLLLHALDGVPLVMTSGNRSDEPIASQDEDALTRLADIADLFLTHNRPIHVRCDDSVTRIVDNQELPLRRSRGYAPQPLGLPFDCSRPILAVGGQLKGTFALGRGRHAFLSHHLGDLDHWDAYRAFERDIFLYEQLFAIRPEVIAHDLHPDYASTRYARQRAGEADLLPVQHHHAHMASCMAENGLSGPVIGVSFDGTGFGTDGAIWGGEFLVGDYCRFRRAAHLRYVGMPGGDQAIREPWRMAVAHLVDAGLSPLSLLGRGVTLAPLSPLGRGVGGEGLSFSPRPCTRGRGVGGEGLSFSPRPCTRGRGVGGEGVVSPSSIRIIEQMLERRFNTPLTSSAGRLFDAVAALAGVRDRVSFEGQAAMELESLATVVTPEGAYPFDLEETEEGDPAEVTLRIDSRALIRAVAEDAAQGIETARIGRRFHSTLVDLIAAVCDRIRKATGLDEVVLSGGVFMNALLTAEATARLSSAGFRVYRHHLVPPNDGGLSLGQLAVAAANYQR